MTTNLNLQKLLRYIKILDELRFLEKIPILYWTGREYEKSNWKPTQAGEMVHCSRLLLRRALKIPSEWKSKPILLRFKWDKRFSIPEGLVYLDEQLVQGIDESHEEVFIPSSQEKSEHELVIDLLGRPPFPVPEAELAIVDLETDALFFDALAALQVVEVLDSEDPNRWRILSILDEALRLLDLREPIGESFYKTVPSIRHFLKEIFKKEEPNLAQVHCVGHAHLDVAWLWTIMETRHKAVRTFASVLRLMDEYPEFCFVQSQPELYLMVKEDHPELYERVKARVSEGRWEATGGMWVEADCNIPNGESLVRQLLYGQRFFLKEFGQYSRILWLPDTFGFNAQLPQLMARSGLKYFMTAKLSWNEYNRFPFDTFRWKGLDGTEVLAYFVTTPSDQWYYTFNADLNASTVLGCWREYRQKGENKDVLLLFGQGDGGGGPNRRMIEIGQRLKNLPGIPTVIFGRAEEFFKRLDSHKNRFPVWVGELYLEYHRGTYTSQARIKSLNRKCEILYKQAELFASFAHILGESYPKEKLMEGWRLMLRNQFHDIIAGTAIPEAYKDAVRDYEISQAIGSDVLEKALLAIVKRINLAERAFVVFNSLPWFRDDVVRVSLPADIEEPFVLVDGETGDTIPYQFVKHCGDKRDIVFLAQNIPPCGYKSFFVQSRMIQKLKKFHSKIRANKEGLENEFFAIKLDKNGHIVSLYDKRCDRELIPQGCKANVFQAFEDRPLQYDAWNIDIFYQDKMWELNDLDDIEVIEEGPIRAGLQLKRSWHNSAIVQRIYVYSGLPRIDFETEVDWHEHHILLKVAFLVEINANRATYEIPFGTIERPNHWNTPWDWARFEVPAQRWADLSEGDYGVSLLNDSKYGYDIKGNVIRLTLIKSATHPDPKADQGLHRFTYALYPHIGDWRNGTIRFASELNEPLLVRVETPHKGLLPTHSSFLSLDKNHVFVAAVKLAEDGDGLIVRVYEGHNTRGKVVLTFPFKIKAAWECNLLEENEESLNPEDCSLRFFIKPYQVRTFKILFT